LGDVPLFGNLFRADSRSRKKTNLMVFLRPVVVRDGASTENLSLSRYEQMRSVQMEVQPAATPGIPAIGSPVLPENTRKP
jgi:general secretion pathway protein D